VTYRTVAVVAATLLYVLDPFDLIPDAIPGLRLLDDVTVLGFPLAMVEQDREGYKGQKIAQVDGTRPNGNKIQGPGEALLDRSPHLNLSAPISLNHVPQSR